MVRDGGRAPPAERGARRRERRHRPRLETFGPNGLVFRGSNGPARSRDALGFSETAGGTLISYHAELTLDGSPGRTGPLLRRSFDRLSDRVVAQMRDVIDGL